MAKAEGLIPSLADLVRDWLDRVPYGDLIMFGNEIFFRSCRIGYVGVDWAYVSFYSDEFFDPENHVNYLKPECKLLACDPEFFNKLSTEIIKVSRQHFTNINHR